MACATWVEELYEWGPVAEFCAPSDFVGELLACNAKVWADEVVPRVRAGLRERVSGCSWRRWQLLLQLGEPPPETASPPLPRAADPQSSGVSKPEPPLKPQPFEAPTPLPAPCPTCVHHARFLRFYQRFLRGAADFADFEALARATPWALRRSDAFLELEILANHAAGRTQTSRRQLKQFLGTGRRGGGGASWKAAAAGVEARCSGELLDGEAEPGAGETGEPGGALQGRGGSDVLGGSAIDSVGERETAAAADSAAATAESAAAARAAGAAANEGCPAGAAAAGSSGPAPPFARHLPPSLLFVSMDDPEIFALVSADLMQRLGNALTAVRQLKREGRAGEAAGTAASRAEDAGSAPEAAVAAGKSEASFGALETPKDAADVPAAELRDLAALVSPAAWAAAILAKLRAGATAVALGLVGPFAALAEGQRDARAVRELAKRAHGTEAAPYLMHVLENLSGRAAAEIRNAAVCFDFAAGRNVAANVKLICEMREPGGETGETESAEVLAATGTGGATGAAGAAAPAAATAAATATVPPPPSVLTLQALAGAISASTGSAQDFARQKLRLRAAALFSLARKHSAVKTVSYLQALNLYEMQRYEAAVAALGDVLDRLPCTNTPPRLLAALCLMRLGRGGEAAEILADAEEALGETVRLLRDIEKAAAEEAAKGDEDGNGGDGGGDGDGSPAPAARGIRAAGAGDGREAAGTADVEYGDFVADDELIVSPAELDEHFSGTNPFAVSEGDRSGNGRGFGRIAAPTAGDAAADDPAARHRCNDVGLLLRQQRVINRLLRASPPTGLHATAEFAQLETLFLPSWHELLGIDVAALAAAGAGGPLDGAAAAAAAGEARDFHGLIRAHIAREQSGGRQEPPPATHARRRRPEA